MTAAPMSRRTVLRGTAGAAASIAAPAAAATVTTPDAELLALWDRWQGIARQTAEANAQLETATAALPEWAQRSFPEHPGGQLFCGMGVQDLTLATIRAFNGRTEAIVADWRDMPQGETRTEMRAEWIKRRTEGRQRVAWWREEMAVIEAEKRKAGIAKLDGLLEGLAAEMVEVENRIKAMPAAGVAGVAIKLRLFRALTLGTEGTENDLDWRDTLPMAALSDVERLAEAGGAA